MAKPISFTKRDLEKKKQEKRLAKQQKKEERKSNGGRIAAAAAQIAQAAWRGGVPSAAAMCIGTESTPINRRA